MATFEIRKLAEQLKETRPRLFQSTFGASRVIRDNSKIALRVKQISKVIAFELPVIMIAPELENPSLIKDKYRIDRELKQSTFSSLFVVK